MKITRRALALSALAGAAAAQPPSQPPAAGDLDQEARQQVETTSQALLRHEIAMSAEPAFEFKP